MEKELEYRMIDIELINIKGESVFTKMKIHSPKALIYKYYEYISKYLIKKTILAFKLIDEEGFLLDLTDDNEYNKGYDTGNIKLNYIISVEDITAYMSFDFYLNINHETEIYLDFTMPITTNIDCTVDELKLDIMNKMTFNDFIHIDTLLDNISFNKKNLAEEFYIHFTNYKFNNSPELILDNINLNLPCFNNRLYDGDSIDKLYDFRLNPIRNLIRATFIIN